MRTISSGDFSGSMEKIVPGGTRVPRKTGSPLITPGCRTMTSASAAEEPPALVSMIATRARNSMFEDRDAYIQCDLRPGVNDCNAGPMRRDQKLIATDGRTSMRSGRRATSSVASLLATELAHDFRLSDPPWPGALPWCAAPKARVIVVSTRPK
jgi:hypothetical protein